MLHLFVEQTPVLRHSHHGGAKRTAIPVRSRLNLVHQFKASSQGRCRTDRMGLSVSLVQKGPGSSRVTSPSGCPLHISVVLRSKLGLGTPATLRLPPHH